MDKAPEEINSPLLVSYPRSGCNWLQAVMELYFNRHRGGKGKGSPSWIETPFEDPMWDHQHDGGPGIITKYPTIFLWRNPVDCMFSRNMMEFEGNIDAGSLHKFCEDYCKLFNKWYISEDPEIHGGGLVLSVRYENVLRYPHKEMKRISKFFGKKRFSYKRSRMAFEIVGDKKSVFEKNGPARFKVECSTREEEYEVAKREFKQKWEEEILKQVESIKNFL